VSSFRELDGRLLVLFDGYCGLCNRAVRWLLRRDRRDRMRFAPLESAKVAGIVARGGVDAPVLKARPSTILVMRDVGKPAERILIRSDAVLEILRELPQPWPTVAVALRLIPRAVRDLAYRLVARWRYRIWGRLDSCPLPSLDERDRFL
jgi:predicted DCC family thiol-disulfide oxidoreductase YuxK